MSNHGRFDTKMYLFGDEEEGVGNQKELPSSLLINEVMPHQNQ